MTETDLHEWTVTGMGCASCARKVTGTVERLPGASEVSVALMSERLRLRLDVSQTGKARVEQVVRSLGYEIFDKGVQPPRKGFVLPPAPLGSTEAAALPGVADLTDTAAEPARRSEPRWYQTARELAREI